ncbi:hypothetical protein COLO4_21469 [Corchorus olitorius]|uniref:Transposase, Ptta/En/Spm, plant n=1 Tax=Corchorus olitorius TaxID=93759 RepID=A0A1R3ISZ2_9ROSI|nr:hypothetical protein COLO4_21469 [Corchorus olitorius]
MMNRGKGKGIGKMPTIEYSGTKRASQSSASKIMRGGKKPSSQPTASKGIPKSNTIRRQMMIALEDQDPDYVIEDDETQTPSDYSTEGDSDDDTQAENSILVTSSEKKKGRGRYTGKKLDIKTEGGKKTLDIEMPPDIERAVGANARDVANFIGYVVRTYAPIELGSWKPAFEAKGEKMLNEIKHKFKYPGNDERFESFCVATMRRMFRLWKNRLHKHYKSFSNDKERLKNTPDNLSPEQWKACIALFGSEKFKVDPVTGEKPTANIIWFEQHARKNADGKMEYNDEESKRVGLVQKNEEERVVQTTQEQMLVQVLGATSGYRPGFGYGKKGLTKAAHATEIMQQQHREKISELMGINTKLEEMIAKMQA